MQFAPQPAITNDEIIDAQCFRAEKGWVFISPADDTISYSTDSCADAIEHNNRIHVRVIVRRNST